MILPDAKTLHVALSERLFSCARQRVGRGAGCRHWQHAAVHTVDLQRARGMHAAGIFEISLDLTGLALAAAAHAPPRPTRRSF